MQVTLKESMDTQRLPSKGFGESSALIMDPALLYSPWSVLTDDVTPAAIFPDGNLSRNSSSQLFPFWAADRDHSSLQEMMVQFGNGSSDVIDTSSFYQDAFQKIEEDDMESIYHGFQGLDLMDSWLLGDKKDPYLASLDPSTVLRSYCNQDALLEGPLFGLRDDISLNKRECDQCMQDGSQDVLNASCEVSGEFGMYAFHNRSNSNNPRLQKEIKVEHGRDKYLKYQNFMEQSRLACDPSSPSYKEKWPRTSQYGQYPFGGHEDYDAHPPQQKTFSPSQSHYGIQHSKVNGRTWKTGENLSPNLQNSYLSSRKLHSHCQTNAVDSSCNFTPAENFEFQNGDFRLRGKSALACSEGDALSSSLKSSLPNGKSSSPGNSSQVSSPGLSNIYCNGNLAKDLLTHSPKPSYRSKISQISLEGRQDRQAKPKEGRPGAWPRGMTPGNTNMNSPGCHYRLDPLVSEYHHSQHSYPSRWSSDPASENSDKHLYNQTKRSPDGCDDGKGMRRNKDWLPQSGAYGGSSQHQYINKYWCKQDQEKSCASDLGSAQFASPFELMMGVLKQNPRPAQLGLHDSAGGGRINDSFTLPQSELPFPDLMEKPQGEDLSHVSPFVCEPLNGDVPPPYFWFPPPINKYRPTRYCSGPGNELHVQLEQCYEQWRTLEKERRKTEANLARYFPGQRVSSYIHTPIPGLPANPTRVDRLIVDQFREQARVVVLVGKMERMCNTPVHSNIITTLEHHLEAIRFTQQRRKDEIVNTANRQRQGGPIYSDDKEILALAAVLRGLATLTRKARTALWCALQMTTPKRSPATGAWHAELERALLELCNPGDGEPLSSGAGGIQPPTGPLSH